MYISIKKPCRFTAPDANRNLRLVMTCATSSLKSLYHVWAGTLGAVHPNRFTSEMVELTWKEESDQDLIICRIMQVDISLTS